MTNLKQQIALHAIMDESHHSYRASPAIWDLTVLPATRHKWTHPSQKAGDRFTCLRGMEGRVDLGYMAMHRPGTELAISRWQVLHHQAAQSPCHNINTWEIGSPVHHKYKLLHGTSRSTRNYRTTWLYPTTLNTINIQTYLHNSRNCFSITSNL